MKCRAVILFLCWLTATCRALSPAIIPLPQQMQARPGTFTLCPPTSIPGSQSTARIVSDPSSHETAQYLGMLLSKSTGRQFPVVVTNASSSVSGAILLTTANALTNLGSEGYELTVNPDSVVIRAPAQGGVFYGIQSLLQLLPPEIMSLQPTNGIAWTAPCVYIQDQPRFQWRGWMVDVVRHFFNTDELKKLIDSMALHKLNTLHLHLADDQGWRLEILKYPNVTQIGAWRTNIDFDLNPRASTAFNTNGMYGGYYTQSDMRNLIAYAQQRHITIIPEIEMPGHSTAGLASYPQLGCTNGPFNMDIPNYGNDIYSVGKTNTIQFLHDVLTEVMALFPSQFIHIGGDEVSSTLWNSTPEDQAAMQQAGITPGTSAALVAYQSWFSQQMANWIQSQGRTMIGWSEIMNGGVISNSAVMDWKNGSSSVAVPTATAKQFVVMTPSAVCYLDHNETSGLTYGPEPPGRTPVITVSNFYNFEPIPTNLPPQYTSYILGAQGNMWDEYVPSIKNVEFKSFPRLCAMAEVTWTAAALKDYTSFTQRLVTHEMRLASMGVNYNREVGYQIGTWTPSLISTSATTLSWDVTTNITSPGEIVLSLRYTTGANGLWTYSASLFENGVQIDQDVHNGWTGSSFTNPVYILQLPAKRPGASYVIKASVAGRGGTNSTGNVYLPNWD